MAGITERNQQKLDLANAGFSLRYIDEWQPKATLYRHKPSYAADGTVSEGIGTVAAGVPGNPDYVLRKARIGLFPWAPSESCTCQWCVARKDEVGTVAETGEGAADQESVDCQECGETVYALTKAGALSRLRVHMKTH